MNEDLPGRHEPLHRERRGPVLWLTGCNGPVNALSQPVRRGLAEGVTAGDADPAVEAIVVHCEGRSFFAGADLAELELGLRAPGLLEFVTACEDARKPVIAAVHGTVFGGGVVVAYACDYRIAAAGTRFAMPEVGLGLLPAFGGTQYLPRLLGVEAALQLIIDGDQWDAQRARQAGLVDEIVPAPELLATAAAWARRHLPKRRVRDATAHLADVPATTTAFTKRRQTMASRAPDFEAPHICLQVMEAGLQMPLAQALLCEHEAFLYLLQSPQSRRLRQLFFAERRLRRGGFDRGAIEQRLRLAGPAPDDLLRVSRRLLHEGAVPDVATLDALLVEVTGAPRHAPSLIETLLGAPP
ncbi:enoyl-CoA hydratase/isomerase family protein [Roseateles toxinivorans]|uniref:Enoyl-CoA hydratase/carnithine racemase n=1 Tax=Roseateles toxinivorans TaxID=270368 RepID=A0A4R6QDZ4_9BURK|nr:enoyl-CoA hydratase/isomerase family protein [Roseateles toxinivorans]TDP60437.1 enoyl-CoA hydratase/carnithine racemase [Roseateles toxinivorans]